MARVSKANMGEKNPSEYAEGTQRAKRARKKVAGQLALLIEDAEMTGSDALVGRRVRAYAEAVKSGDHFAVRGALMELGQAAGATVAAMDLQAPRQRRAHPVRQAA